MKVQTKNLFQKFAEKVILLGKCFKTGSPRHFLTQNPNYIFQLVLDFAKSYRENLIASKLWTLDIDILHVVSVIIMQNDS